MHLLYRRVKIVLLATLAVLLFAPLPAHAASFNITTSPLPVLLATKPGQTVSTNLRVQNSGSETARFNVSLKKFKANGSTGKPILQNRAPGDSYFDWVSFSETSFVADPGVWHSITMTIKTPPDAGFGYYYAVVFSGETPKANPGGTTNQLQGATAVLVLLDVQVPGEKRQLAIDSFSADKKLYEYLPANFTVKVKNPGDIHLSPSGTIFITKGKKTIATLDVNPAGGNILPNSTRDFATSWHDGFPVFEPKHDASGVLTNKHGQPVYQLHWDFSKANHLRFGHYTANLVLTYDNGSRDVPLSAAVSFWVVPWGLILTVLALLIIPPLLVYLIMKRRMKSQAGKGGKKDA
jgi:hypothetical protein